MCPPSRLQGYQGKRVGEPEGVTFLRDGGKAQVWLVLAHELPMPYALSTFRLWLEEAQVLCARTTRVFFRLDLFKPEAVFGESVEIPYQGPDIGDPSFKFDSNSIT